MKHSELIVMLTYNDCTVENAAQIFEQCKESKAKFWGFKEKSLPPAEMKELFKLMKSCGKTTFLEVVEYDEKAGLEGAKLELECGCDILMGTVFYDSINDFCQKNKLKYMPFVGKISERPSILEGEIPEIIAQAQSYIDKGVFGCDLLAYRYTQDAPTLIKEFLNQIKEPVCIAGSIDSYQKLDQVKEAQPWAFTIGSAFFDKAFGQDFHQQINTVCEYMN